jgi:hypothetical protein
VSALRGGSARSRSVELTKLFSPRWIVLRAATIARASRRVFAADTQGRVPASR